MPDTLSGAMGNVFRVLGDVAFTWVPATVGAVTGTAPGSPPPLQLLSSPVGASDALAYLQQVSPPAQYEALFRDWAELVALAAVVSIMAVAALVYSVIKLREVHHHEHLHFEALAHPVAARDTSGVELRWERLMGEMISDDERRWRLAILEADIMLNELLDVLGYRGETMADKMKQVNRADFRTIDQAWEAHRVRNAIAHEGSAHLLNAREARRVMGLYEQVFREFKVIE